jgi:hypothetical protein
MSALDKMAEAYWNSFRRGFGKVGGPVNEYPTWKKGPKSVTTETERCMRHAVEALKPFWGKPFEEVFPDRPAERSAARTVNDDAMAGKLKK